MSSGSGIAGQAGVRGLPAGFDFLFVYWYLIRFTGEPVLVGRPRRQDVCLALLKCDYHEATKRMPHAWLDELPHTHIALDDAMEQEALFINMLRHNVHGRRSGMTSDEPTRSPPPFCPRLRRPSACVARCSMMACSPPMTLPVTGKLMARRRA
jgi:hypothetical protein